MRRYEVSSGWKLLTYCNFLLGFGGALPLDVRPTLRGLIRVGEALPKLYSTDYTVTDRVKAFEKDRIRPRYARANLGTRPGGVWCGLSEFSHTIYRPLGR